MPALCLSEGALCNMNSLLLAERARDTLTPAKLLLLSAGQTELWWEMRHSCAAGRQAPFLTAKPSPCGSVLNYDSAFPKEIL